VVNKKDRTKEITYPALDQAHGRLHYLIYTPGAPTLTVIYNLKNHIHIQTISHFDLVRNGEHDATLTFIPQKQTNPMGKEVPGHLQLLYPANGAQQAEVVTLYFDNRRHCLETEQKIATAVPLVDYEQKQLTGLFLRKSINHKATIVQPNEYHLFHFDIPHTNEMILEARRDKDTTGQNVKIAFQRVGSEYASGLMILKLGHLYGTEKNIQEVNVAYYMANDSSIAMTFIDFNRNNVELIGQVMQEAPEDNEIQFPVRYLWTTEVRPLF
jgi:hypothetical protein